MTSFRYEGVGETRVIAASTMTRFSWVIRVALARRASIESFLWEGPGRHMYI